MKGTHKTQRHLFYFFLYNNSFFVLKTKIFLHKTFTLSIILYASSTWCTACNTHRKTLQTLQNNLLKQIANAWFEKNSTVYRYLKILPTIDLNRNQTRKVYKAAEHHPNHLLRTHTTYDQNDIIINRRPITFLTEL